MEFCRKCAVAYTCGRHDWYCASCKAEVAAARAAKPRSGKAKRTEPCQNPVCKNLVVGGGTSGKKGAVYCSRECKHADHAENRAMRLAAEEILKESRISVVTTHGKCRYCGKWTVTPGRHAPRECCKERACQSAYANERQRLANGQPIGTVVFTCKGCGAPYETKNIGAKSWCLGCAGERNRAKRVWHEPVSWRRVMERDGWKCQHCGRETPESARGTMADNAPELNHVLPVAQGGAHSYANTQCLCRACNAAKHDKIEAEPSLAGLTDMAEYRTAKYPPCPSRARKLAGIPRTCNCGCGETYTPYASSSAGGGNDKYKAGHWKRTAEAREAAHVFEMTHQNGRKGGCYGHVRLGVGTAQDTVAAAPDAATSGEQEPMYAPVPGIKYPSGEATSSYGGPELAAAQAAMRARMAAKPCAMVTVTS